MALPATIRVKISDEAGGSISFSPVVVKEMSIRELIEIVLAAAGSKAPGRISEILSHGSLVIGASRFRWDVFHPEPGSVAAILASFPDADPSTLFRPDFCRAVTIRTKASAIALSAEPLRRKRWLRRRSFFDELAKIALGAPLRYTGYSYRDRADCFVLSVDSGARDKVLAALPLIPHSALRKQLSIEPIESIEFQAQRGA